MALTGPPGVRPFTRSVRLNSSVKIKNKRQIKKQRKDAVLLLCDLAVPSQLQRENVRPSDWSSDNSCCPHTHTHTQQSLKKVCDATGEPEETFSSLSPKKKSASRLSFAKLWISSEIYMKGSTRSTSPGVSRSWGCVTLKMEVKDLGAPSLFLLVFVPLCWKQWQLLPRYIRAVSLLFFSLLPWTRTAEQHRGADGRRRVFVYLSGQRMPEELLDCNG